MKGSDRKLEPTLFSICADRIGKLGKKFFSLEQSFKERDQELQDVIERVEYLYAQWLMLPIPPSKAVSQRAPERAYKEKEKEEDEVYVADDEEPEHDNVFFDVWRDVTLDELKATKKELEEAESTIARLDEELEQTKRLDKNKHLAAILEDRDRAWTQDYQPRIKELRQEVARLEQENKDLSIMYSRDCVDCRLCLQEVARLEQENKDLLKSQYQSIDWEPDNDNIVRKGARFDNFDLTRHNQQVFENLRAAYERLQQAHTVLRAKVQEDRGE